MIPMHNVDFNFVSNCISSLDVRATSTVMYSGHINPRYLRICFHPNHRPSLSLGALKGFPEPRI